MRDRGLETEMAEDLSDLSPLAQKAMFGGLCWMYRGHLLACAGSEGLLFRLGKGNDGWALAEPGVVALQMGQRAMEGWVRLSHDHCGNEALRARLTTAARAFVESLPDRE